MLLLAAHFMWSLILPLFVVGLVLIMIGMGIREYYFQEASPDDYEGVSKRFAGAKTDVWAAQNYFDRCMLKNGKLTKHNCRKICKMIHHENYLQGQDDCLEKVYDALNKQEAKSHPNSVAVSVAGKAYGTVVYDFGSGITVSSVQSTRSKKAPRVVIQCYSSIPGNVPSLSPVHSKQLIELLSDFIADSSPKLERGFNDEEI